MPKRLFTWPWYNAKQCSHRTSSSPTNYSILISAMVRWQMMGMVYILCWAFQSEPILRSELFYSTDSVDFTSRFFNIYLSPICIPLWHVIFHTEKENYYRFGEELDCTLNLLFFFYFPTLKWRYKNRSRKNRKLRRSPGFVQHFP